MIATSEKMKKNAPLPVACPFRAALELLEGKWKFAIVYALLTQGTLRFKALEREVGAITPRMLTAALKELEGYGIVQRQAYATVPPTVEYSLTDRGRSLEPVLTAIRAWGEVHIEKATGLLQ